MAPHSSFRYWELEILLTLLNLEAYLVELGEMAT